MNTTHVLKCGDCLELLKTVPDASVDMVLCDLPYGTTQNKWDSVIPFEELWREYRRVAKTNAAIVLTASQPFTSTLILSNPKAFKYDWVWSKAPTGFLNAKYMPMRAHESVLVFCFAGKPIYNAQGLKPWGKMTGGATTLTTNYNTIKPKGVTEFTGWPQSIIKFGPDRPSVHPTQKPVALFSYLIHTYTNEGDTVLDNCCGSGTTGAACVETNRSSIQFELSPEYFKIAGDRLDSAIENWKPEAVTNE